MVTTAGFILTSMIRRAIGTVRAPLGVSKAVQEDLDTSSKQLKLKL